MFFQILLQPAQDTVALSRDGVSYAMIALLVCGVLFGFFLLVFFMRWIRKAQRPELNGLTPTKIKRLWEQVRQSAKQGKMGEKIAIIEADKLLDQVLKSMLIPGETMGERLKMAAYTYPRIKDIWQAHKLRNQLVHESSFELHGEAHWALNDYEQALRILHVLE